MDDIETLNVESISVKLPDVCRVCLSDECDGRTELYSIEDVYVQPNSAQHLNSFRDILSLFVNDEFEALHEDLLPKSICTKCAARAQDAYQFIEQCQRSDKLLEQCFSLADVKAKKNLTEPSQDEATSVHEVIELEFIDAEQKEEEEQQVTKSRPRDVKMMRKGTRWYCDKCDKSFTQSQTLRRHYRIHDETGNNKTPCTECGRLFLRSDDLVRHMRTHTGERPYLCKLCPKRYKQNSELKEHMRTHRRVKEFKCTECSKKFASRNGLYVHLKVHRGEKSHACPHCSKLFTTSSERISHVRNIHSAALLDRPSILEQRLIKDSV